METFTCPACGERLFFRNAVCGCGAAVAFDPEMRAFALLDDACAPCANRDAIGCNWRAGGAGGGLCASCAMTRTMPDLAVADNAALWTEAEEAKRQVLANLMRWGLFTARDASPAPVFDMLAEQTESGAARVMMGHLDGVVTINIAEADPAVREARRQQMAERYRTMTGHFRHELGHFVFARLAAAEGFLDAFRALFGDERADYAEALRRHYARPAADSDPDHVTPYAAAHPHEDWAETFAHHQHLVDIADSAARMCLISPALAAVGGADFDPYACDDAEQVLRVAVELGVAVNHVNRAMGLHDVYPFVLTAAVREKLAFAHRWIGAAA